MSTRRHRLANLRYTSTTNAGLWLDKFIFDQRTEPDPGQEKKTSRQFLVEKVAAMNVSSAYPPFFERWQRTLIDSGADYRDVETQGRLAIGLGEESVLETSICLHHTYGVPYIPGSALKGLAASFSRQFLGDPWQSNTFAYRTVFGDTQTAGHVTFFDALPKPNEVTLHPDVITVHHDEYYRRPPAGPPADWDDPTPVPFLSATGKFLMALSGPTEWLAATFEILQHALAHAGIGAKTSSGYGRMKLASARIADPDQLKADQVISAIQALKGAVVAGQIDEFCRIWRDSKISPNQKRRIAAAIIAKVKEVGREKQSRDKDWYKELLASI